MDNIIKLEKINKIYKMKQEDLHVLNNINISFQTGKFYLISGHSGVGKTTLINIIGLIDNYTSGEYYLDNKKITEYKNTNLANLRRDYIGFVFQSFYLEENLTAIENVCLPMLINKKINPKERISKGKELLELVGLSERLNHLPKELSGGEKQRVAIARALANDPKILLCDEPTGNLDEENETEVFKILNVLAKKGKCVIVVSHSNYAKKYADEIIRLNKGKIEV